MKKNMTYGEALNALAEGNCVSREGWNGKNLFIYKQVVSTIGADVIPTMTSMPNAAKEILLNRKNPSITFTNQMVIVNANGIANSWVASSSDTFAKDWFIYTLEDEKEEKNLI